jgi:hypothetical protein
MFKNVGSQKIQLFAFDTTTGAPKTGDAANITAYVNKDHAGATILTDTSATEVDATNAKGVYLFDLTQAETNADSLSFTAKSSTANISITPILNVQTYPASFGAFVTPPTAIENADALLDRNMATGTDSGSPTVRTVRQALRFLRNKWAISGGTLDVKKEDDTTSSWTSTVATDPAADPITGNDPAS